MQEESRGRGVRNIFGGVGPGVFGDEGVNFLRAGLLTKFLEFRALDFDLVGEASGHENEGAKSFIDTTDDATGRRATTVADVSEALGINEGTGEQKIGAAADIDDRSERDRRPAWWRAGLCRDVAWAGDREIDQERSDARGARATASSKNSLRLRNSEFGQHQWPQITAANGPLPGGRTRYAGTRPPLGLA